MKFAVLEEVVKAMCRFSRIMIGIGMCAILTSNCTMARKTGDQPESGAGSSAAKSDLDVSTASSTIVAAESQQALDNDDNDSPKVMATATLHPLVETVTSTESSSRLDSVTSDVATEAVLSTHRVVAGDTLTRIAERYAVSVASLMQANDLPNPDLLEVGQVINLPKPPVDYTPSFRSLPDSRLVRSIRAASFDLDGFIRSHGGVLSRMNVSLTSRKADGSTQAADFSAGEIVERVSVEYSVDARILLAFLEYFAGLVTDSAVDSEIQLYPLVEAQESNRLLRAGLYNQLSWLADRLNQGYYGWKYRGERILEFSDGSRLFYDQNLNAGSVAVQYALAQMSRDTDWTVDTGDAGIYRTYAELFDDPFIDDYETTPADLQQPSLTLPFPRADTWRFTGGFHGGWGNGSAWAAIDFSPPEESPQGGFCYTSSYPATAVARGTIARLDEGIVILDLDEDSNEGSGWTILYLHLDHHDALRQGQVVEAGNILGYASCLGGVTTATHLHIARRYNGEWIPADCNRCPPGVDVPPFVMSNWKVVGLASQLYQGFMVHLLDNRSAVAEQGRFASINEISW